MRYTITLMGTSLMRASLNAASLNSVSRARRLILRSVALVFAGALPSVAEVPRVVTDIPPVYALVAQVMGDLGQPQMFLDKGGDEHDLQLRPSQAAALNAAALLVWIGPRLTPGLDAARASAPDTLISLALLDDPATHRQDFGAKAAVAGAAEEEEPTTGLDPHAWLNPDNGRVWLGLIAQALSDIDPANAATYAANAATATARIAALDADLTARLIPAQGREFVTFHDAFGYFAGHFGLSDGGALASGDAAAPGAARVAALQEQIGSGRVACVFPEAQHDAKLLNELADAAAVRIGPALDPVGSTFDASPDAYDQVLSAIADAMVSCLVP